MVIAKAYAAWVHYLHNLLPRLSPDSGEHEQELLVRRDTKVPEGNGEREQLSPSTGDKT